MKQAAADACLELSEDTLHVDDIECSIEYNPECPPLKFETSRSKYKIAIFSCGCFVSPQRRFLKMDGVKRVVAGYTGGEYSTPSYDDTEDHRHSIFVEYNPQKVSYKELLEMWRNNDDPFTYEPNVAYQSGIFTLNEGQEQEAMEFLRTLEEKESYRNTKLFVTVEPAWNYTFYQAEERYQNYLGKQILSARERYIAWANDKIPSCMYPIVE